MEEQLTLLENSIDSLVDQVAELQEKYGILLAEKESWLAQRTALKTRCDTACDRIDEILNEIHSSATVSGE